MKSPVAQYLLLVTIYDRRKHWREYDANSGGMIAIPGKGVFVDILQTPFDPPHNRSMSKPSSLDYPRQEGVQE